MAKLKPDAITAADLEEFVKSESDFGFEMQVLSRLRKNDFTCEHSSTYVDPVTQKIRQFDIRAHSKRLGMVALAVECKNLRPNNPLLLSAVPRLPREAFHQVIVQNTDLQPSSLVQDRHGRETAYPADVPVAKDRNQIGRAASGDFTTGDGDTYEKLNQAVNSCADLVQQMGSRTTPPLRRAIVPVLVVPDGVLWQVDYDSEGAVVTSPRSVETGTVYLDHSWPYQGRSGPPQRYRLSHMEVWTLSALDGLAERCFGPYGFFC